MLNFSKSGGAETVFTMNDQPKPFFTSKEEAWMFMDNISDDLYKMMHTLNRDTAALTHIDESTADLETLRYLIRKCWEHYHQRSDDLWDIYHDSDEYERPHPDQTVLDDFDKEQGQ